MIKRNKKPRFSKRGVLLLAVALVCIAGVAAFYLINRSAEQPDSTDTSYAPPTEEEKQQVEDHKKDLAKEKDKEGEQPPAPEVAVIITYAGQYINNIEVSSYVTGVIEDDGTCTLNLAKGTQKVTKTHTGLADAKHTTCPTFRVPKEDLEPGTWQATVQYGSDATDNVSTSKDIEVN